MREDCVRHGCMRPYQVELALSIGRSIEYGIRLMVIQTPIWEPRFFFSAGC